MAALLLSQTFKDKKHPGHELNITFLLEGCSMMMSIMVKSRDWAVFSQSAMLVMSRTQATVGQASMVAPEVVHALFC